MFAETRLLTEWVAQNYPTTEWFSQLRVGSDPGVVGIVYRDDADRRLARNFCRRVDAAIITPAEVLLIEACMYNATEKVGRLQEYLLLARATPELLPYRGRPLVAVLLTGQHDPIAEVLCKRLGFRYVHWEPPWIGDFYALYPDRVRRTPHVGLIEALEAAP